MTNIPRLDQIRTILDSGQEPEKVSVRTLLSWFAAERRGWWVVRYINSKLEEAGLETVPHFNSTYIDNYIEFRKKELVTGIDEPSEVIVSPSPSEEAENIVEFDGDEIVLDDPTYRIEKLEAANKDLISVNPQSELKEAITKMIMFDFSQLPVMQNARRGLKGVISWRSIGTRLSLGQQSTVVGDFMETSYQLISNETSLFKALPIIIEHDYVLVKNSTNEISGIVTASDLSQQFKQLTEPFLMVSEIEKHIRQILDRLSIDRIRSAKDEKDMEREINSVDDLNFGEYLRLLQDPDIWDGLNLKTDRQTFCSYMDKVREIRNQIMHFDPDGLDGESIETLRNFVRLLQTLRDLGVFR